MLIRFVMNNIFSFGEEKEFNMLSAPRLRTLKEHKYDINGFNILKMSSIYSANRAGKSNVVNALSLLQDLVIDESVPRKISDIEFKFKKNKNKEPLMFVVEFFQNDKSFLYGLEILNGIVITEELYQTGLGRTKDILLFERKTNVENKKITITSPLLDNNEKNRVLKSVIEDNLAKENKTIFKLLTTFDNENLSDVEIAFEWFQNTLIIVTPDAKPSALAHHIDVDKEFKNYAQDMMKSFNIGINDIKTEKKTLKEFFGEDDMSELDNIIKEVEASAKKMVGLRAKNGSEIIIVKEEDEVYVKKLQIEHMGKNDIKAMFDLDEESDGTIRLLDFTPAFQDIVTNKKVYIIDEIERSIHPLLIKELVRKFSADNETKGQLIFTTHESNLLDQSIFRQDEIWFAEKDKNGCTDLYSLSDFKEHNTIDIQKGYLTGRYGSIPFLGNLTDLNWNQYDIEK